MEKHSRTNRTQAKSPLETITANLTLSGFTLALINLPGHLDKRIPIKYGAVQVQKRGKGIKGTRWMPWRLQPMKDAASCEKLR